MKTKLCRPVLVKSNKKDTHIFKKHNTLYHTKGMITSGGNIQAMELILISLDPNEKIEGKYYDEFTRKIYNTNGAEYGKAPHCQNVIATQFQLSPEYIQQFIEDYNKGEVKDVEIEWEFEEGEFLTELEDCPYCPEINRPKLTNGFVTIVEKELERGITIKNADEPITYTEEELKSKLKTLLNESISYPENFITGVCLDSSKFNHWFERNKKK